MLNNSNKNLAPICLFVYNRPWHLRRTLESLEDNYLADESKLFIFSDGPKENIKNNDMKKIEEVRKIVKEKKWCREVTVKEYEKNQGLADSIVSGVTEIVNKFGKVIVLEDDLVLSRGFLKYMNDALDLYENENRVMHISGYMYPIQKNMPETFFFNVTSCWGWGTWQRSWKLFNNDTEELIKNFKSKKDIKSFNLDNSYNWHSHLMANQKGELKTWAIKWYASVFQLNGFCLHPGKTLVRNIGNDESGEHCGANNDYLEQEITEKISVKRIPVEKNLEALDIIKKFLLQQKPENRFKFYLCDFSSRIWKFIAQ